jgi:hypothetical protein
VSRRLAQLDLVETSLTDCCPSLPASAPATRETLLLVLSLLLQDAHMPAAEQMCYLAALSVSGDGLARCKALFAETGRSLSDLEHVQLPVSG